MDILGIAKLRIANGKKWSPKQTTVWQNLESILQHCIVYTGPGGSGKSDLTTTMPGFFTACGFDVCVSSASDADVDTFACELVQNKPEDENMFVRYYSVIRKEATDDLDEEDSDEQY